MISKDQILKVYESADTLEKLDERYDANMGKKGQITEGFKGLGALPLEEKKQQGSFLSEMKTLVDQLYANKQKEFKKIAIDFKLKQDLVDFSLPGVALDRGYATLLAKTRKKVEDIFQRMGFLTVYGNEVVTPYENFFALNIPSTHPATEMHDTFYLKQKDKDGNPLLLRTHTSAMQNTLLKEHGAPLRAAVIGKVFRFENMDASHDTMFLQAEGLVVDKNLSIAHCKSLLQKILSELFGKEIKMRLRPAYFPFVEPGFEIDAGCIMCDGAGCSLCKHTGWIELLGAGMVHPHVLSEGGIDPEEYSGFAFGIGINRIVSLLNGIKDIRLFTNGDVRFIQSFK